MTAPRQPAALAGGVSLLERAVSYVLGVLPAAAVQDLRRPTPCAEWDLGALLAHVNDSLDALNEALALGHVAVLDGAVLDQAASHAGTGGGLLAGVRGRASLLLGALAGADPDGVPGGPPADKGAGLVSVGECPVPVDLIVGAGAVELAVHGWDVARVCGGAAEIPAGLAADALLISGALVSAADRPVRFGHPVPVPAGATPSDRLVGYLGRDPG